MHVNNSEVDEVTTQRKLSFFLPLFQTSCKDSQGHRSSFSVQTAFMYYLNLVPKLYLYSLFRKRSEGIKRWVWIWSRSHFRTWALGLLPGQNFALFSWHLLCWLFQHQYPLLNCTWVKSWRTFLLIQDEQWMSQLQLSLWGCLLSSQRSAVKLFNKWWSSRWLWLGLLIEISIFICRCTARCSLGQNFLNTCVHLSKFLLNLEIRRSGLYFGDQKYVTMWRMH